MKAWVLHIKSEYDRDYYFAFASAPTEPQIIGKQEEVAALEDIDTEEEGWDDLVLVVAVKGCDLIGEPTQSATSGEG